MKIIKIHLIIMYKLQFIIFHVVINFILYKSIEIFESYFSNTKLSLYELFFYKCRAYLEITLIDYLVRFFFIEITF